MTLEDVDEAVRPEPPPPGTIRHVEDNVYEEFVSGWERQLYACKVSGADNVASAATEIAAMKREIANPPEPSLSDVRFDAKGRATRMLDAVGAPVTEVYVEGERMSWPQQEAAATAHRAGTATAADNAFLDALIAQRGASETRDSLSTLITTKAAEFRELAAKLGGLRSRTHTAIDTATDAAGVDAALAGLQEALRTQT